MKVFLSWSGDRSKYIAETFRDWLPMVIQALDPWISVDIAKGQKWTEELGSALKESKVCILCLTKDNIKSPYMHYEAGAIGANDNSSNCTFLFDVDENSVKYPLSAFQNTKFDKEEIFKLILSISESLTRNGHKPVKGDILRKTFELNWEGLEEALKKTPTTHVEEPKRNQDDLLSEVLSIVRRLDLNSSATNQLTPFWGAEEGKLRARKYSAQDISDRIKFVEEAVLKSLRFLKLNEREKLGPEEVRLLFAYFNSILPEARVKNSEIFEALEKLGKIE